MISSEVFDRIIGEQIRARLAAETALAEALREIARLKAQPPADDQARAMMESR